MSVATALDEFSALDSLFPTSVIPSTRLERVARHGASLAGADHAAVTVWDRGLRFSVLAWSGPIALEIEPLQFHYCEGPALAETTADLGLTRSDDVRTDPRWPTFGPALADRTGVTSLLSQRFVTERGGIGAFNLYANEPAAFASLRLPVVEALAAHAAAAISAPPVPAACNERIEADRDLGCAMGILMQSEGLDRDQALGLLRVHSQHLLLSIGALAQLVIQFGGLPGQ